MSAETKPGKNIETLEELQLALMQPSIYSLAGGRWKSTPSAWVKSQQFAMVARQVSAKYFRWSIKTPSRNGGKSRPSTQAGRFA